MAPTPRCHGTGVAISPCPRAVQGQRDESCGHTVAVTLELLSPLRAEPTGKQLLPWAPAQRSGQWTAGRGRSESSHASHAAPSPAPRIYHFTDLLARRWGWLRGCSAPGRIPLQKCPQAPPATVTKEGDRCRTRPSEGGWPEHVRCRL